MKSVKRGVLGLLCAAVAAMAWNWTAVAADGSGEKATPAQSGTLSAADAAVIEKQKATYPMDTCVVAGEKLGEHGAPVDYVYKGRLVRFCCKGCIATFEKDPAKYLSKIDEAAKDKAKTDAPKAAAPTEHVHH